MDPAESWGFGTQVIVTPNVTKYRQEKSRMSGISPAPEAARLLGKPEPLPAHF
jgi:hypothetical protein